MSLVARQPRQDDLMAPAVTSASVATPPKALVIGATGFVGSRLLAELRIHHPDCIGTTWRIQSRLPVLDLHQPDITPLDLGRRGYSHAIVAAAVAGLARSEAHPEYTRARNVEGTLELARQLTAEGIKVVFFSSDNVFDGITGEYDDSARPNPINEYGRQKAEVEARLAELTDGNHLVLRLAKMFGATRGDGTLLDEIAARLSRGERLRAAWDQLFTPMLVDDSVAAILALLSTDLSGTAHVAGPETWSRWSLAVAVANALGLADDRVERVSLDDLKESFPRPKRNDLVTRRLKEATSITFTPIRSTVATIASQYQLGCVR